MTRSLLVIAHVKHPSIGILERAAHTAGWELDIVHPFAGEPLPAPDAVEALVVLGGPQSAYDTEGNPYLRDEVAYLGAVHVQGVPILALCLGTHLLADALGGSSRAGDAGLECGFVDVEASGSDLPLGGRYFSFHSDTASPPPEATVLATTAKYVQSWRLGASLAIQYHPELDAEGIDALLAIEESKLARYGIDVAALRDSVSEELAPPVPGERLLNAWFAGLANHHTSSHHPPISHPANR